VGELVEDLLWEADDKIFKSLKVGLKFGIGVWGSFRGFKPISELVIVGEVVFEEVVLLFRGELEEFN
jgi:hypothetical protein